MRSSYQGPQTIDVVTKLSDAQRQLIVSEVALTSSYSELKALIMKRSAEMQGEVAAYALLQAANLRETVELEALAGLNMEQATALMDAQEFVSDSPPWGPPADTFLSLDQTCPSHSPTDFVGAAACS